LLYSFFTFALGGSEWSKCPGCFTPGKDGWYPSNGGWVGPRIGLKVLDKGKKNWFFSVKQKSGKKRSVLNLGCLKGQRKNT